MKLTVELTDLQIQMLRQFHTRQCEGAPDNMGTRKPLHIVQSKNEQGTYDDVAYFFTLAEAIRYETYQSHNLRAPRVFVTGTGYANNGDWEPFYDALHALGAAITESGATANPV